MIIANAFSYRDEFHPGCDMSQTRSSAAAEVLAWCGWLVFTAKGLKVRKRGL